MAPAVQSTACRQALMASICFVKKMTPWELEELLPLLLQSSGTYANLLWDATEYETKQRSFLSWQVCQESSRSIEPRLRWFFLHEHLHWASGAEILLRVDSLWTTCAQGRGAQDSDFWQKSASSTHKYLSGGGDGELGSQADESLGIQV